MEVSASRSIVRQRVDEFYQCQKERIAAENRNRAYMQGHDDNLAMSVGSDQILELKRLAELVAVRRVEAALEGHPVMPWAMGIPGINRAVIGRIVGLIDDPTKFARFSNLRSHAGLCHLTNKLKKGEKAKFSMRFKTALFVAFDCMLKQQNTNLKHPPEQRYTDIYRNWRSVYAVRHGTGDVDKKTGGKDGSGNSYTSDDETARQWPDGRQHFAAKNKMMDVFLFHLWEEWLTQIGRPVPDLYVHAVLGHHMKYERAKFSSYEAAKAKMRKHSTTKSLDDDINELKLDIVGPTGKVPVIV